MLPSLTLSAFSWPPAGAFSWPAAFDSLWEEGAVALGAATSLSLALDLLRSTLRSPPASASFGRLGDAWRKVCRRVRHRKLNYEPNVTLST